MPEPGPALRVSVVCAWPGRVWLRELRLPPGSTVADALVASRWQDAPELSERLPATPKAGIFGRLAAPGTLLRDGDRVELYRPLQADPVSRRRQRAAGLRDVGSA